jgi:hypothetical protein
MNSHKPISESEVLITGLARDISNVIESEVKQLKNAFADFVKVSFFIVESDSSDNTVDKLRSLAANDSNFRYLSLGTLQAKLPERIERLSHCREVCAEFARRASVDYVCVSDLDGTNTLLTAEAVRSCWNRSDWDVCTANQKGFYYDIYALRHRMWCPRDYNLDISFLESQGMHPMKARRNAVLKKQKEIKENSDWLEVDSAFGGLAIYKSKAFSEGRYSHRDSHNGGVVCEHVPFNKKVRDCGGQIFINPLLINHEVKRYSSKLSYVRYGFQYFFSMVSPSCFKDWEESRSSVGNLAIIRKWARRQRRRDKK